MSLLEDAWLCNRRNPSVRPPPLSPSSAERTHVLAEVEAQLAENPCDADARVWKGRRPCYLGRLEEAIAVYEAGEILLPKDARFARHIGYRLISLRRF